jgi:hypothetical protein
MSHATPLPWWRGWLPLIVLPVAVSVIPIAWPRWVFMWVLAFAIYCGCKWLTWRRTRIHAPLWKHLGYLFAWPGMDAVAFFNTGPLPEQRKPKAMEWLFAFSKIVLGVVILFGVRLLPPESPYVTGWIGMVGMIFVLHFGVFHVLSCAWRANGVEARPLMDWPLTAQSLSEFWGRRWNTAFRDLTHRFLFRPLTRRYGPRVALAVGFVFSGLIHDVVISFPANGGYGGPTLFFLIQGVGVFIERSGFGQRIGLGRGVRGWLFTALCLLAPAYLLFHPPFVEGVIVPMLHDLGVV